MRFIGNLLLLLRFHLRTKSGGLFLSTLSVPNLLKALNQLYENMGLSTTQTIATLFDGMARHSPEGVYFKQRAEQVGYKQAIAERDSGDPIPGSKI